MTVTLLAAVAVVAGIGLILGALIAFTAKKFEVTADPRIELVQSLLPGANCGGCGFAGCADLANAVVTQGVSPSKCSACSEEQIGKIAAALGVEAAPHEKMVAVVFCGGSVSRAKRSAQYNGILDCRSASLVAGGGGKACRFGCLGYGSCARVCPFGAIEIRDGLAVVHPELCRGCGKCEGICPRKLIRLVPATAKIHVYCNSLDKPAQKRKNCSVPCLTCRKCVKADPDHMQIQGQLVRVNYNDPPAESLVEQAQCPTGCLQTEIRHRNLVPMPADPKKESVK